MSQKQNPAYGRVKSARPTAKSFDVRPATKPKQPRSDFPGVGMTLNTYAGKGDDRARRRGSQNRPASPGRWARFRSKFTRKRVILAIVAVLFLAGGWVGWKVFYNAHRLFGNSVFSVLTDGKLDGESTGRVNILMAGNSADDAGHEGGGLTDSIMIASIDTKNDTAFMLSVPRDLYVDIPERGYSHQKINSAYTVGEREKFNDAGYFEGGMGELQKVIQDNMGITLHYYALVNYGALRQAVDSVGGIDFKVESSDKRGLYDSSKDYTTNGPMVKLTNGTHKLDGQEALNLARARGHGRGSYGFANSDFTRTENQRKLILALRAKATTAGVLTNPVKLGGLFDAVGANVETNMSLANVRRLYQVTKDIPGGSIKSVGLNDADGKNLLDNYTTSRGESALVPAAGLDDFSDIQRYLQRLTSNNLIVREAAEVVILNGTVTSGLAARESDLLEKKNVNVSSVADADAETYTVTQIIDLSGGTKPKTLALLKKHFQGSTTTTTNPYGTEYDVDFIVVLGADRPIPGNTSEN